METIGEILLYAGYGAVLAGYVCICLCGFADGIESGLRSIIFPYTGFGLARQRFPWIIWIWAGGIALIVVGALFY